MLEDNSLKSRIANVFLRPYNINLNNINQYDNLNNIETDSCIKNTNNNNLYYSPSTNIPNSNYKNYNNINNNYYNNIENKYYIKYIEIS